jgi:hypothetical protein
MKFTSPRLKGQWPLPENNENGSTTAALLGGLSGYVLP